MIIYVNEVPYSRKYNDKEAQLKSLVEWYYFGEIHTITERNPRIIIDLIKHYNAMQFITYSIEEFDVSPTMICELILSMIKLDCIFTSYRESFYFDKNNALEVYPKIFEIFRKDIQKSTMI